MFFPRKTRMIMDRNHKRRDGAGHEGLCGHGYWRHQGGLGRFWRGQDTAGENQVPLGRQPLRGGVLPAGGSPAAGLLGRLALPEEDLAGIGVGLPCMVRYPAGEVVLCAMLPALNGFGVKACLEGLFPGVQVAVDNDAHCAALAESRHGAGKGRQHMLYCPVSTGLSSGIIIDGKLFRGSSGFAGESGHTILTPGQGIACGCGNQGCVQSYASGGMIVRHIRQWIDAGEQTLMVQLAGAPEKIDARHLEMAARDGDAMALRALDQMALYLGVWVFNLYITLNINCFVFGGGLVNMGELLFGRVRQVFDSYCHTEEPVEFLFAQCGQEAGLLGALELLF